MCLKNYMLLVLSIFSPSSSGKIGQARLPPLTRQRVWLHEVDQARQRMVRLQAAREAVRTRWSLSSSEEQKSQFLKELSGIENEVVQNNADIAKLKRQQDLMTTRFASIPDMVRKEQVESSNPSIQSIKDRITALEVDRSKAATRYQPESEVIRKLDSEMATAIPKPAPRPIAFSIRTTRNVLESILVYSSARSISWADVPAHIRQNLSSRAHFADERSRILSALMSADWNRQKTSSSAFVKPLPSIT